MTCDALFTQRFATGACLFFNEMKHFTGTRLPTLFLRHFLSFKLESSRADLNDLRRPPHFGWLIAWANDHDDWAVWHTKLSHQDNSRASTSTRLLLLCAQTELWRIPMLKLEAVVGILRTYKSAHWPHKNIKITPILVTLVHSDGPVHACKTSAHFLFVSKLWQFRSKNIDSPAPDRRHFFECACAWPEIHMEARSPAFPWLAGAGVYWHAPESCPLEGKQTDMTWLTIRTHLMLKCCVWCKRWCNLN